MAVSGAKMKGKNIKISKDTTELFFISIVEIFVLCLIYLTLKAQAYCSFFKIYHMQRLKISNRWQQKIKSVNLNDIRQQEAIT